MKDASNCSSPNCKWVKDFADAIDSLYLWRYLTPLDVWEPKNKLGSTSETGMHWLSLLSQLCAPEPILHKRKTSDVFARPFSKSNLRECTNWPPMSKLEGLDLAPSRNAWPRSSVWVFLGHFTRNWNAIKEQSDENAKAVRSFSPQRPTRESEIEGEDPLKEQVVQSLLNEHKNQNGALSFDRCHLVCKIS